MNAPRYAQCYPRVFCRLELGKSDISESSDRSTETFRKFSIFDCSASVSLSEETDAPRQIAVVGTAVVGVRSTLTAVRGSLGRPRTLSCFVVWSRNRPLENRDVSNLPKEVFRSNRADFRYFEYTESK